MEPELSIKTKVDSCALIITLSGSLDGRTVAELEEIVKGGLVNERDELIFDLSNLSYVSSAGMSIFISINHNKRADGGKCPPSESLAVSGPGL